MESFGGTANGIKIPTFVFSEEEEAEQWRRRLPQPLQSGPQRKFPFLLRAALTLLLLLFGITGRIWLAVNPLILVFMASLTFVFHCPLRRLGPIVYPDPQGPLLLVLQPCLPSLLYF